MAKKRAEEADQKGPDAAPSPFEGYDLTPQERSAAEEALPDGCSVLWVGQRGPGFLDFATWPCGQRVRAYYDVES